ncbi:hypothetical protein EJB05_01384, partial [Eragrostis curvula]
SRIDLPGLPGSFSIDLNSQPPLAPPRQGLGDPSAQPPGAPARGGPRHASATPQLICAAALKLSSHSAAQLKRLIGALDIPADAEDRNHITKQS